MTRKVVIGLLGIVKDRAQRGKNRWEKWRPTVSLAQHEDFRVDRFEILRQERFEGIGQRVADDIQSVSPESAMRQHAIEFEDPWDFEGVYTALHRFAEQYPFDLDKEEYYVHITTGTHVAQICLFLLTETRHFPAKLLQTSPPTNRHDSIGSFTIIDLDLGRYDKLATRFEDEKSQAHDLLKSGIATRNQAFNRQVSQIEQVAVSSKAPILLMGPTGAGKSRLAQRIFDLKRQRHLIAGDFVEINCATLRGDSAMSALFGHKKGAFTGAMTDRLGLLKTADQGLLFLDEIGELGLDEQAMLLRAVEEKKFLPVGADHEISSDFQLIAGTNRDLHGDVGKGLFREDLLSRLDLWSFHLPGLSERKEDIEPNIEHELDRFASENGRRVRFNKEAAKTYLKFAMSKEATWPSNFRDLNASMTRLATLSPLGRIDVPTVQEEIGRLRSTWSRKSGTESPTASTKSWEKLLGPKYQDRFDRFDLVQLEHVLEVCAESTTLSEAGRTLFSVSRTKRKVANDADRLRKYLGKFDLSWDQIRASSALH